MQLKATAKEGSAARLVRLPRDRREYFAGFGVPVLLVLYQATQDRLFVRWFESFDEEYDNLNSQSMVFRFRVADEWTAETSDRLSRDARIYQALSHLRHALPLPMAIASLADHTAGVSTNAIALALQGESRRLSAAVQWIDPDALDAFGRVVLDSDSVSVRLSDFRSGTTHYHASDWPEGAKIDAARIASDCLVNLAVLLSRADLVDVAAPLFSAYAPRSGIGLRMEMLLEMVGCFVRAHQVDRAIEVAEALDAAPSEDSFHGVLSLTWFVLRDTLEPAEHQRVVDFLKRRIALAESSGDQGESARRHYNLANWLGSIRRHREALAEYRLVVSLDPSYQDRAYYLADLAGTLFELGHFVLAAEAYGRAREMHSREDWLPLHADALMFAGRFAAADNLFSEWRLLGNYGDEWKLKLRALPLVRSFAGDQQERKPVAAWMRARDLGDAALNTEEARIAIECICLDGLCSPAWYVLGGLMLIRACSVGPSIACSFLRS